MKITIQSTTKIVEINGVKVRIWEGETAQGIPVHCYITRIAVSKAQPEKAFAEFEKDLQEHTAPSPAVEAIPLRLII